MLHSGSRERGLTVAGFDSNDEAGLEQGERRWEQSWVVGSWEMPVTGREGLFGFEVSNEDEWIGKSDEVIIKRWGCRGLWSCRWSLPGEWCNGSTIRNRLIIIIKKKTGIGV